MGIDFNKAGLNFSLLKTKYYQNKKSNPTTNSIIEFGQNALKTDTIFSPALNFSEFKITEKCPDSDTFEREENDDGSSSETVIYKNGTQKKITRYADGSYDEIFNSPNGISYMRIKRFGDNGVDYTELYKDSSGFCGKENFYVLDDGTSVSENEYSNGKKHTETYKKNPDGGFTRILKNSDGTGYKESQAFRQDGSSSYSVENEDGSGNTIIYNPDGSYVEILTDSNGTTTINKTDV